MAKAFGTTIAMGAALIAKLTSISGCSLSADTVETTTMDSTEGWREFEGGLKDGGEVSIEGLFDSSDTNGQIALEGLVGGAVTPFTITYPTAIGATWSFNGVVTAIEFGAEMEDNVTFSATIKVSGKPTLGVSASTGASAFVLRNAADDGEADAANYMPTFATGTYYYAVTFTTQTSVRPRITAASHTIKLYVDGVYIETLTSGVSGSAIAISADASKTLRIECQEAGKTAKVYNIVVARIS